MNLYEISIENKIKYIKADSYKVWSNLTNTHNVYTFFVKTKIAKKIISEFINPKYVIKVDPEDNNHLKIIIEDLKKWVHNQALGNIEHVTPNMPVIETTHTLLKNYYIIPKK